VTLLKNQETLMKYEEDKVRDLREKSDRKPKKELKLIDVNSDAITKPLPKTVSTSVSAFVSISVPPHTATTITTTTSVPSHRSDHLLTDLHHLSTCLFQFQLMLNLFLFILQILLPSLFLNLSQQLLQHLKLLLMLFLLIKLILNLLLLLNLLLNMFVFLMLIFK
jgi:hypothetical protein